MQAQPTWEAMLLNRATAGLHSAAPPVRAGPGDHALDDAYRTCRALTRLHSKTFTIASALLPADQRRAMRALYAFCRVTDDTVDEAPRDPSEALRALEAWRERAMHPHPPPNDPVPLAWADARSRFSIPTGYAEQLIDGVARDLRQTRYESFEDLAAYAYGVASTVGLMAMHIIGYQDSRALPYAVKLGVALQMTNILRDVGEDWAHGRLYLPLDELAQYGLTESDIAHMARSGGTDDRWAAFMAFQIARARRLYDEAYPGIGYLTVNGRFAIGAAADLYCAILCGIEAQRYDVFAHRAYVGSAGKLARLPGIWRRSRKAHEALRAE